MPDKLENLALDLTKDYPRSPRALFAGYVIAARVLDKCRAMLNGTEGEYAYNFGIDRVFFEFAAIDSDEFKDFVATGATDEEVADWIKARAKAHSPGDVASWNFTLKCRRISELPPDRQAWVQDYLLANVRPEVQERVIFNFDLLDAEEGRLASPMSEQVQGRLSIFVNGHARQVGATTTLGDLARECDLDGRRLLVELNLETLPRDEWPARTLQHGDRVEFIRVVAGG